MGIYAAQRDEIARQREWERMRNGSKQTHLTRQQQQQPAKNQSAVPQKSQNPILISKNLNYKLVLLHFVWLYFWLKSTAR